MKMMRWILFLTVGFMAAFLIACAPNPTLTPTAANIAPSPIQYARSGGIIGLRDELTIDVKGHALLSRRNVKSEFVLSEANLKQLYDAFQSARFASIPENSMPIGIVADGISYTITFQNRTVKTGDTAVPKALEPLIALLNKVIETQGK